MADNNMDLKNIRVLVVDDQEDITRGLKKIISGLGCFVNTSTSAEEALQVLQDDIYDIVFTDIRMGGMDGIELMERIINQWPNLRVVMITGFGTIELAVECLKKGADHFITKPFNNKEIVEYIQRESVKILAHKQSMMFSDVSNTGHHFIAVSPKMKRIKEIIEQVADSKLPVLIEGESGTGKEIVAREIHLKSPFRDKPFLPINCIAVPDNLLESELFGYKKGAFTGAVKDKTGLFQQADGGTIFLDEIASMSQMFQGKLLRVLQEKMVRPLGSTREYPVDFRIIAASNKPLEELVQKGEFREDLYYRLAVVRIELPPLNERPEDIIALADYFLRKAWKDYMGSENDHPELSDAAINALTSHQWKGNVRELENTIQRALIMCKGKKILPSHLWPLSRGNQDDESEVLLPYEEEKKKVLVEFQTRYITNVLKKTNGNISQAAKMCGLSRAALQRLMKRLEIKTQIN